MAQVIQRTRWRLWKDVIFALFIRQLRSQFNDKLGLSWTVVQPVAIIMLLSLVRGRFDRGETYGMDTFIFLMIGMLTVKTFTLGWSTLASSMRKDKPLYSFRQVHPISSLLTAFTLQFIINIFVIFILVLLCYLMEFELQVADPLWALFLLFEVFVLVFAMGTLSAIAELFIPELAKIRGILSMPLLFISGVFFSLKDIPEEYWVYFLWNPLIHVIEQLREACYPVFVAEGVSSLYVHCLALCLLFFSLATYHIYWKRAISR